MPLLQSLDTICLTLQGRRASLRSALAPGYCISAPLALKNQAAHQLKSVALQVEFTIFHLGPANLSWKCNRTLFVASPQRGEMFIAWRSFSLRRSSVGAQSLLPARQSFRCRVSLLRKSSKRLYFSMVGLPYLYMLGVAASWKTPNGVRNMAGDS